MGHVTEIEQDPLVVALGRAEEAAQKVGICKAFVHLARLLEQDRLEEVIEVVDDLEYAEGALAEALEQSRGAAEALCALLAGRPARAPAAEG